MRVGVAQSAHSVAPLFLAEEQGYFRKVGIRIEVDKASFTGLHISSLAAGKLDVALVAMSPALANAAQQGAPVRIVAARKYSGGACGAWGQFFANLEAFPGALKDFRELEGKRIAYSTPGSLSDFALDMVLDAAGLTRKQVKAVAIKRQESIAALLSGSLDAVMNAPSLKEIPADRRNRFGFLRGAETIHPTMQTAFTAFGERLRGPERELGMLFLSAYNHGSDDFFANRNPAFMRKWALSQGADPDVPVTVCPHEAASRGAVDPEGIRLYLEWATRRRLIPAPVTPDQLLDPSLVSPALKGPA